MKILVLSQYCYPEPDLKCFPIAKELKSRGFQVEILTGYPSHPIGRLYDGYKMRLFHSEYVEGIKVNRVPLFIDRSNSVIKRIVNYLSFALSATCIGIFLIKKPRVIYAYHGPATIAIPAIVFKFIYGSKIYYDINDYWPDSISATGMLRNAILIRIIGLYCKISYGFFDKINVVSKGFKEKLQKLDVPEAKISLIYNWPLPIKSDKSETFQKCKDLYENKFSVVYAGNIGKAQSLEIVIRAATRLKSQGVSDIIFILLGDGVESSMIRQKIIDEKLQSYIVLTGAIPSDNVGEFLEAADVLFLHLKRDPLFAITIPSKLGNYFSVGKPVLCGVEGETAEMVDVCNSGFCFEPDNDLDLYEKLMAIRALRKDELIEMGRNGKEYFENMISFKMGSQKMVRVLEVLGN